MSADSPAYFRLIDLHKDFEGKRVLKGVSLEIPEGQTTVVLGGSGTGKSVLLKHLNGLIRPDRGTIEMQSQELTGRSESELTPLRRKIGFVFQDGALFDSLSVGENILFPLLELGEKDPAILEEKLQSVLEKVELEGEAQKMPSRLSGGMKKRVALARSLIMEPECLLCDEPTAGLDPILSETVAHLIHKMTREQDLTAVVVTHDLAAMRIMADRVVFLFEGEVMYEGALAGLDQTGDTRIDSFLRASGGGG